MTIEQWLEVGILIATFLLVLITGYYAWQAHRTVAEMRWGARRVQVPVIALDMRKSVEDNKRGLDPVPPNLPRGGTGECGWGYFYQVVVRNVGNAPARQLDVELTCANREQTDYHIEPEHWAVGILGIGERALDCRPAYAELAETQISHQSSPSAQPQVIVKATWQNISGIRYRAEAAFELPPAKAHRRLDDLQIWTKLNEWAEEVG